MENQQNNTLKVNFAEKRFNTYSSGFIFSSKNEENVVVSQDGEVLVYFNPETQYYTQFSSPLGRTVIISHPDNIISVYANLSSFEDEALKAQKIEQGVVIAKVGGDAQKSGLYDKNESLEFQLIDTQNKSAINPSILLPNIENNFSIYPGNLYLVGKNGTSFKIDEKRVFQAGVYSVYRDFVAGKMSLKTTISLNGVDVSVINYDALLCKDGLLTVKGRNYYPFNKIFAEKRQYLGDIDITRGKNAITFTITDYNQTERKSTYSIDAF